MKSSYSGGRSTTNPQVVLVVEGVVHSHNVGDIFTLGQNVNFHAEVLQFFIVSNWDLLEGGAVVARRRFRLIHGGRWEGGFQKRGEVRI